MGRTIKISELKKFDVVQYHNSAWFYNKNGILEERDGYREIHISSFNKDNQEVELIGRMEYKENTEWDDEKNQGAQ